MSHYKSERHGFEVIDDLCVITISGYSPKLELFVNGVDGDDHFATWNIDGKMYETTIPNNVSIAEAIHIASEWADKLRDESEKVSLL